MRRTNSKSELGSMMIEAIAMLGLIAMVTPVLYKKSAERTSELQDINAAGEIRSIINAVDDYVGANYNIIAGKDETTHSVTNSCTPSTVEYDNFSPSNDHMAVPIGHFCEFLPYGILNSDGTAKGSKLFSDQTKIILKMTGHEAEGEDDKDQKVITAFVITDPHNELPILRASSISSMIGGNGGYVTEVTGEGEEATGTISGNMGIWSISDAKRDLGVSVKKHAIVAASTAGISSQTATIEDMTDPEKFLHRTEETDKYLNTMTTTLYMGGEGIDNIDVDGRNDIVNIGHLAVGAADPGGHALYIAGGDIQIDDKVTISNSGDITVAGNITGVNGTFSGDVSGVNGTFSEKVSSKTAEFGAEGKLVTAIDGVLSAVTGNFGDGAVTINDGDETSKKTTINQPLEVILTGKDGEGDCTSVDDDNCALKVTGGVSISGNLNVGKTFNAKNLHAQETLTVGGTNATDKTILDVRDNKFEFGTEGNRTISATNTTFDVTATGGATMTDGAATVTTKSGDVSATGNTVSLNDTALKVTSDAVTSQVKSFKIAQDLGEGGNNKPYLNVNTIGEKGGLTVNQMDTYFDGNGKHSNVYLHDSVFRLQKKTEDNSYKDVVRIGQTADSNAQIDISGDGVTMKTAPDGNNVLRVNLSSDASKSDTNYPIYIRKGAIEMKDGMTYGEIYYRPYIQAEKLISTETVDDMLFYNSSPDEKGKVHATTHSQKALVFR